MRGLALLAIVLTSAAQTPVRLFEDAVAALARADYAAAEAGFRRVLESAPHDAATLQNLGLVYARTNRLDQAIATYRLALESNPNNRSLLLNLGLAYLKQQSYGPALSAIETVVRADPTGRTARDIHLLYPLCAGYLKQDSSEQGRRSVSTFLTALSPAAANLVRCKLHLAGERLEEAASECRAALRLDPSLPGVHLELARVLVTQRDPDAATELDAAIHEASQDPEALYDLGATLFQAGRTAEAIDYLERAQKADPTFWGSYFQLGKIRLQQHRPGDAVALLSKAADLNSASAAAFYELGRALMATGKTVEARHAMDRVRQLQATELEGEAKALRKQ